MLVQHNKKLANSFYMHYIKGGQLTFVYYFHSRPKKFTGGELKLYDTKITGGRAVAQSSFELLEPRHNRIEFFESSIFHEVLPVQSSGLFEDSRFAVTGWVRI